MQPLTRIISWIDKGYEDGVATSNYVMGVIIGVAGLIALSVESAAITRSAIAFAIFIFALFVWRMVASFRRQAKKADRRRGRKR